MLRRESLLWEKIFQSSDLSQSLYPHAWQIDKFYFIQLSERSRHSWR